MEQDKLQAFITQQIQLDWHDKFAIIHNVCEQIELRHAQGITYKYLSPDTIFINRSDFKVELQGLNEGHLNKDLVHWTFSSPELMRHMRNPHTHNLSSATDIWSLGLLINVVFTMQDLRYVRGCVGFTSITPYFFEVIKICMKVESAERPSSLQLLQFFQDFEETYLKRCDYNMVLAYSLFKQQRAICTTINLVKLPQVEVSGLPENSSQREDIVIKSSNKDLQEISIQYRNFTFHVNPEKNYHGMLFCNLNDKPQRIKSKKIIKIQDQIEVLFSRVDSKEGEIELKVCNKSTGVDDSFSFKVELDGIIKIGNKDHLCQVIIGDLDLHFTLEIQRKQNGFYVTKRDNVKQQQDMQQSIELKHNDSKGDNLLLEALIELDSDMIIQPLTTIIAESQRYFVKSIN